ncbi:hypothetical protein MKW98_029766 [Papaver atlanticum]|uniref:Uncharacterized protein n=1 Tax=Papaver atlanticum TaxID=357466 RepID=A0AAD4T3X8_9MAGN|nr:hypothetical protein MKW98_029766 [Papaver atlanticum]
MSNGCEAGKSSWPELVGCRGKTAENTIEYENRNVNAIVIPEGSPVTLDLRCDRVRVFVDKTGKVVQTPVIG